MCVFYLCRGGDILQQCVCACVCAKISQKVMTRFWLIVLEGWDMAAVTVVLILVAIWVPFPYFAPIFTPSCTFDGLAIVYYYSPGGSTRLGRSVHSTQCCVVKTLIYTVLKSICFIVLCGKGSLIQNANIALPGSSTLTVPGSPATAGAQNIYMVCSFTISLLLLLLLLLSLLVLSIFMPPHNVVWPEAYWFCPVCPCVRLSVRPETLLTRYLAEYLAHFHQTYINDALWDRDERFTVWGQKVKVTVE